MKLKLADDLSLPVDIVTQTIAVLAKRRAGKSYLMRRLVEQLFKTGQQVVLVDPKGDQWGIRSDADGKGPGLPFVILGGERGDVPLEPGAGAIVGKMVVEERVSCVIDLSLFRKGEVAEFMGGPSPPRDKREGFLEVLYRLKALEKFRTPLMLVIDEADAIAPQKPGDKEERMLGAAEDIVRRGGQRGLGCVFLTQRSAVLNKNVLTQAEIMIALRTIAPQDLSAMNAWIDVHGTVEQKKTLMESLPSLPIGDAWVWSPGWPTADGIFKRIHTAPIETYDSGASPKPGEKRKEPKTVADVDLDALKRQMAETIERQKADDPRELRKQLAEAKSQLAAKEKILAQVDAKTQAIEDKLDRVGPKTKEAINSLKADLVRHRRALEAAVKIIVKVKAFDFSVETPEDRTALEQAIAAAVKQITGPIEKRVTGLASRVEGIKKQAADAEAAITALLDEKIELSVQVQKSEPFKVSPAPRQPASRPVHTVSHEGSLPPGEHATLTAALQYPGLDRKRLSVLTGYKRSSRDAYIARLVSKGLIEVMANALHPTEAGHAALNGSFEPLPTGEALVEYWRQRLPEGERKTLETLLDGGDVAREAIDEATGYKRSSRDAYLTRLKARGLVEFTGRGTVRASAELFE